MSPRIGRGLLLISLVATIMSCSGRSATPGGVDSSSETTAVTGGLSRETQARFELPGAVVVSLAGNEVGSPVAVWTTHDAVLAGLIDLDTNELVARTQVSEGLTPFPHPIERPAATVGPNGEVTIAFVAIAEGGESVYLTRWDGGEPTAPEAVSGPPRPETVLVHATNDADGDPVLAWLETSTLSVGLPQAGNIVEQEEVDDLTCDCCNPVPLLFGDQLFVSYRDMDRIDGEIVRDVVAIARDGDRWEGPLAIADDHWFIDACPFSGPSTVIADGALVVAWMDARQSVHPDQDETTIWVDRMEEGGDSFGEDLAITTEGIHRWPVMAVDASGTIHLVWETRGADGGLSYATSEDGGRTFSAPILLVERDPDAGAPTSPTVIVHDQLLLVSWADGSDGHIAVWSLSENGSR